MKLESHSTIWLGYLTSSSAPGGLAIADGWSGASPSWSGPSVAALLATPPALADWEEDAERSIFPRGLGFPHWIRNGQPATTARPWQDSAAASAASRVAKLTKAHRERCTHTMDLIAPKAEKKARI
jgi:hypothetical protein